MPDTCNVSDTRPDTQPDTCPITRPNNIIPAFTAKPTAARTTITATQHDHRNVTRILPKPQGQSPTQLPPEQKSNHNSLKLA